MNKILKTLLTAVLFFSVGTAVNAESDDGESQDNSSTTTYVATVNDKTYETVQAAINDNDNATINVVADTTEDITVPSGKTITLVIAEGKTITNNSSHTITNNGTLTVTGAGTVDNISHGRGAVYNNVGATATLEGSVTFTRSCETGIDKDNPGGNSWYTIKNYGTMSINDKVTVNQGSTGHDSYSSLIANGWFGYEKAREKGEPDTSSSPVAYLTINGGNISGGLNTIKNDDAGYLTVNGGTITNTNQWTIQNVNVLEINNGTFIASQNTDYIIDTQRKNDTYNKGLTTINGGTFIANTNGKIFDGYRDPDPTVYGGKYSNDISEYLLEGYNLAKIDDKYVVVEDGENAPVTSPITPAVDETTFDEVSNVVQVEDATVTGVKLEANQIEKVVDEEKTKVEEAVKSAVNQSNDVEILLPLNVNLKAITKNTTTGVVNETEVTKLNNKITAIIYLDETTLATLKDKTIKVVREHTEDDVTEYAVLDATLEANALKFETDKFSNYYVVTYKVSTLDDTKKNNTTTVTTKSSTTKSTAGWDDGGPFTTDNCGNVFDRWGNKIYEAKGCNVGGYNLVRTSVED